MCYMYNFLYRIFLFLIKYTAYSTQYSTPCNLLKFAASDYDNYLEEEQIGSDVKSDRDLFWPSSSHYSCEFDQVSDKTEGKEGVD